MQPKNSAILRISAIDQKGLVAAVTNFISQNNGNIIDLEQHVDDIDKEFFMRVEWTLNEFKLAAQQLEENFNRTIGQPFKMNWDIQYSAAKPKMAIFVSKMSHCLLDILSRYQSTELQVDIPIIISNHQALEAMVTNLGIKFVHLPITSDNKKSQEKKHNNRK